MSEKRKDNRGRVLRPGESQRKDLTYQYRYTDRMGVRRYSYAKTLPELREKEQQIQKDLEDGIGGNISKLSVEKLVELYISHKKRIRSSTMAIYQGQLKTIKRYPISRMAVKDVKRSDVITMCESMFGDGLSYSTIRLYKSLLSSAFKFAVDDDAIRKNPASIRLSDYIEDNSQTVVAMTEAQKSSFLSFVWGSRCYSKYYDMMVILFETGIRASELCGLTIDDINFNDESIHINKQLKKDNGRLTICDLKSSSSHRTIPMTKRVRVALKNVICDRDEKKSVASYTEHIINGQKGFLFVSKTGKPKIGNEIWSLVHRISRAYNTANKTTIRITPHVMRHTYCTMLSNAHVPPKTIMYLMGHSSIDMQRIYDDVQYDVVKKEILSLQSAM